MDPHPTAVNLTLCKRVIIDERTKLRSLFDIINRIFVEDFPSAPQRFYVHAEITGGIGTGILALRVQRLRNDENVYVQQHEVAFPDRTDILSPIFEVRSVRFPAAGFYAAELLMDDRLIVGARRRFEVLQVSEQ